MSSELEDNPDHLDDPSATSSSAETNPSPEKKDNGSTEHAKPRRRRRGKKRKHSRRESGGAASEADNHKHSGDGELREEHDRTEEFHDSSWDSDENFSCDVDTFSDVIIRPLNAPKAPENSTQFIMDDHNDCHFYMSFETPNPYLADRTVPEGDGGDIIEPLEDAAYRDIDYQYESPQDFDNSAYYDREFELSYKNNRFDELMRLSRTELEDALHGLEVRLKEVSEEMVQENPGSILEKLQAELLELQEKNCYLKESNSNLLSMLPKDVYDLPCGDVVSPEVTPQTVMPVLDVNHKQSGISETFHECNDNVFPEEVVMADVSVPKCDTTFFSSESNSERLVVVPPKSGNRSSVNSSYGNDSSGFEPSGLSLNSQILQHCQPAKILIKDDIRSLTISSSSDIFHAKCSSSVPKEGGMSPSETSVN